MSAQSRPALILGAFLCLGLFALGGFAYQAVHDMKQYERSVVVKGLSEQVHLADQVIWPIGFSVAAEAPAELYSALERDADKISTYLQKQGVAANNISIVMPQVTDKLADRYNNQVNDKPRFTAQQTVTVFSNDVKMIRAIMGDISSLGKTGVVFGATNYNQPAEYSFTKLNDIKPMMIEEATNKAREVAEKFAADSFSGLGKIKRASQGNFSIASRDRNNPHIKKIRVVSTVEYYLID
tara:strand:- start:185138 stop:185854 length:717 start_codon:yes stop_codon:yes gene_type:complete